MTYDAYTATELEFERLRFKQRRYAERSNGNQAMTSAIKMLSSFSEFIAAANRSKDARSDRGPACRESQALGHGDVSCWRGFRVAA